MKDYRNAENNPLNKTFQEVWTESYSDPQEEEKIDGSKLPATTMNINGAQSSFFKL